MCNGGFFAFDCTSAGSASIWCGKWHCFPRLLIFFFLTDASGRARSSFVPLRPISSRSRAMCLTRHVLTEPCVRTYVYPHLICRNLCSSRTITSPAPSLPPSLPPTCRASVAIETRRWKCVVFDPAAHCHWDVASRRALYSIALMCIIFSFYKNKTIELPPQNTITYCSTAGWRAGRAGRDIVTRAWHFGGIRKSVFMCKTSAAPRTVTTPPPQTKKWCVPWHDDFRKFFVSSIRCFDWNVCYEAYS